MISCKILDKYSNVLPEALVEYIISFTCDRRGYNMVLYKHRIKAKLFEMKRIREEIDYFHHLGYTIAWLRPSGLQKKQTPEFIQSLKQGKPIVTYHTGCYSTSCQERKARHLVFMRIFKYKKFTERLYGESILKLI
jgi:Fe-S oxidoreductase